MSKTKAIKMLNEKIDKLIINGKTDTKEYKRLCNMHKKLVFNQ